MRDVKRLALQHWPEFDTDISFCFKGLYLSALMLTLSGCGAGDTGSAMPIVISAASEAVRLGDSDALKITQGSTTLTGGEWSVSGDGSNGQIGQDGIFHAPSLIPKQNPILVMYSISGKTYSHEIQLLNPIPVITSVSPSVLHAANNEVIINGSRFVPGATIIANGLPIQTSQIDSSHLKATISIAGNSSSSINLAVSNPAPGDNTSSPFAVKISLASVTISPSTLSGGPIAISITGNDLDPSTIVALDGKQLKSTASSSSQITATGYLPPWRAGAASLSLSTNPGQAAWFETKLPITPTAVSFDVASRFLMQAGFGPRPDLVAHIQQIGLDPFIKEQQSMATVPYDTADPIAGVITIMSRAVLGANPLRMRVAWALQTFLARSGIFIQPSNFPFEMKMEADATRNFRDVLQDVSSDVSMAQFLNLAGNASSMDPMIHPNQNFARELLQLFSIGTVLLNDDGTVQTSSDGSPIPAYDQDTILALSRALTGWNLPAPKDPAYTYFGIDWSGTLVANESQHDHGEKLIFGNVRLPAGQSASKDRQMALDAIFAHPNLPPFVSRILIQRLVKSSPSPEYVKRIAHVFEDNGRGVRGDLASITRAILLDPEARAGDTTSSPSDGFLQEPYLFQTFVMSITGWASSDSQPSYLPSSLNEPIFYPQTVLSFFSPSYKIPGTEINSPEFQIINDITLINRSQLLWGMLSGQVAGFDRVDSAWLYTNFQTVPEVVEAMNHIAYHGQMQKEQQDFITNYCSNFASNDPRFATECAIFLALNADSYTVTR